jgi:hypothetical protein
VNGDPAASGKCDNVPVSGFDSINRTECARSETV